MPNRQKQKGNRYETEIVKRLQERGVEAERAWGSDGRALGENAETDVRAVAEGRKYTIQCKRRASIASYIKPPQDVFCTMLREDRGETLVVLRLEDFIKMMKR